MYDPRPLGGSPSLKLRFYMPKISPSNHAVVCLRELFVICITTRLHPSLSSAKFAAIR